MFCINLHFMFFLPQCLCFFPPLSMQTHLFQKNYNISPNKVVSSPQKSVPWQILLVLKDAAGFLAILCGIIQHSFCRILVIYTCVILDVWRWSTGAHYISPYHVSRVFSTVRRGLVNHFCSDIYNWIVIWNWLCLWLTNEHSSSYLYSSSDVKSQTGI